MDLMQLECFIQCVRCGTGAIAAEKLNISQPTLSRTLTSLEAELNVQLFNRTGRRLELNEHGKLFLEYATEALDVIDHGTAMLKNLRGDVLGTVTIVCLSFNGILSDCVKEYLVKKPWVNFQFLDALKEHMRSNVDILLTHNLSSSHVGSAYFPISKQLFEEEYVLVFSSDYRQLPEGKNTLSIEEASDFTFIMMSSDYNSIGYDYWNDLKFRAGNKPIHTIEITDFLQKLTFLSNGVGAAFLPEVCIPIAKKVVPSLRTFNLENLNVNRKVSVARKRKTDMSEASVDFWNFMLEYYHLPADIKD